MLLERFGGIVRWIARLIRGIADPLLHPLRRRRAMAGIRHGISEILVVCYGNICRSPYAAAVLRSELGPHGPRVVSAGFFGPGRASPDTALAVAQERMLPLDGHQSQLLTAPMAAKASLIVVMEQVHARQLKSMFDGCDDRIVFLGDFDPQPIASRGLPDPYGSEPAVFHACYARIERCSRRLSEAIRRSDQRRQIQSWAQ